MPLEAQTRLLRVLQEGEYTAVGGRAPIRADVRIVAATHRDLRAADPPGPVPRGPVLPPERRADPPAAAARAQLPTSRRWSGISRRWRRARACRSKRLDDAAMERLRRLSLAGQCPRAGKPGAAAGRALFAGGDRASTSSRPSSATRRRRRSPAGGRQRARARRRPSSAISTAISPPTRAACRRPGSTIGCCARSSGR